MPGHRSVHDRPQAQASGHDSAPVAIVDQYLVDKYFKGRSAIAPPGLNGVFWEQVQANHAQFQFGVDLIFAAGDLITALPRSTRVTIKGD